MRPSAYPSTLHLRQPSLRTTTLPRRRNAGAAGAVAAAVALLSQPAAAQSTRTSTPPDVAASANAAQRLPEVVVTAEKRTSTVQKTPVSVTVLTGEDLADRGLSDMRSVAQQVPGVSFKTAGPGQTEFEMRGLTSTGGESPTVGFYFDEVALTPPAMAQNGKVVVDPNLFDLNRVEVLRGPQGTLYGAGSMGGTIKLVTNQPDPTKFSATAQGIASVTEGGGANHAENAMLNVPLSKDVAALRVVLTDKWVAGWIDRDVVSPFPAETNNSTTRGDVTKAPLVKRVDHVNSERLQGARASVLLAPTDRLSITGGLLYQQIRQGGSNLIDAPPNNAVHYQPFDVSEPFKDHFSLYSLTVKYDFDAFQLVSATSHWERTQSQTQDISEAMQDYIGGFFGPAADFPFETSTGGLGAGSISEDDHTRQFSQEVRLVSKGESAFQWLLGAYYSKFDATSHVYSFYDGFTALFGTNNLADNHRQIAVKQKALFGEASYQFLDALRGTVGLRWFSYDSDSVTSVSGVSANGTSDPLFGHASNSGVNPRFNLAYTPTRDLTLYTTAAKGFRPGGPNSPIPVPPCPGAAPTAFGPDNVWSYELGEKARLLDSRLQVNGAFYYTNWSDTQQQVAPGCGFKYTANAGKARVYGAEIEVALRVADGVVVSQNAGYTHATNAQSVPLAGVVSGQRLLDVPQVTANTSVTYKRPFGDDLEFVARATNSYVGSSQDLTFARNTLPSYDLVDTRIGIESGRWSVSLFVDNLTNKQALLANTGSLAANVGTFNRVATNQPRTIGTDISLRF